MVVAMDSRVPPPPPPGSRHSNLKKSFKLAMRLLLTACSKVDVYKAFATFPDAEREVLYHLFVKVIERLHETIEEEFENICQETQVGATLDIVEQLVEEQNLDVLNGEKTNVEDIKNIFLRVKKDEVLYLTSLIEKSEEQNNLMRARIASLKANQNSTTADAVGKVHFATADAIEKLRSWNVELGNLQ